MSSEQLVNEMKNLIVEVSGLSDDCTGDFSAARSLIWDLRDLLDRFDNECKQSELDVSVLRELVDTMRGKLYSCRRNVLGAEWKSVKIKRCFDDHVRLSDDFVVAMVDSLGVSDDVMLDRGISIKRDR